MTQYLSETLDFAIKANKNKVAFSGIFLRCLCLYGEVQDMSLSSWQPDIELCES
ncbi:hypothetical protein NIES4073_18050 [Kalymmatonema gypsitolerans NIES-4073]|nr:hypothetical protein NIES4073_18050 [Scytonema sp. NIES-4073]